MPKAISARSIPRPAGGLRDLPLLEVGLRPFFLLGAIWAVVALALWLAALEGYMSIGNPYGGVIWHGHEMIYGFAGAIVAGFLLTAVPTWTGRPNLSGSVLGLLALVWITGRIAMLVPESIGVAIAAALDLSFFALLLGLTVRQIVATRNWRNLPIGVAPGILLVGSGLVHLEALGIASTAALGSRLGIAVFVLLVTVIGGRIIPAFTRNWLNSVKPGGLLPALPDRFDVATILATMLTLILWLAAPISIACAIIAVATSFAHLVRLGRWRGWRTGSEPLVWILHLAYAWLPVSFGLVALSAVWPSTVPESAALHALTAGVMATMMVAMMTRAALGHTGRPLTADTATVSVYLLVIAAAALRVAASLIPTLFLPLIGISGALWIAAFALYVVTYGPKLWSSRVAPA